MQTVNYSWIGLSAAAPLVFLICAWVLGVYHSFRKYWRSVDLFLLAIIVQELLTALQAFIYALLSLTNPSSGILCSIFIWSLSATRALQAATICSLLVDRALTSQWPYKYRFSVRRHQIRYHLVVLATMAALVGVAAILARPSEIQSNFESCKFLPHSLHVRLALFLLSLYGILFVISAVSACVVQTTRTCKGGALIQTELHQDMTPITHGTTGSSTTTASSVRAPCMKGVRGSQQPLTCSSSTASSTSSVGRLHSSTTDLISLPNRPYPLHHQRTAKVPFTRKSPNTLLDDFRWGTSISVASLCFVVNHIPYMVLLVFGTFFPMMLPDWPMENVSLWLSLFEGLLLPVVLRICDSTFGDAAINSYSNRKRSTYAQEPDSPFRVKDEIKCFPLTNGSLFSSLHAMNVESSPFNLLHSSSNLKNQQHVPVALSRTRMGALSSQDFRALRQCPPRMQESFGHHFFYNSDEPSSMGSIEGRDHGPIYSDTLNKTCSMDGSLKDDHIYATLSETFGSYSSFSDEYLGDHNRCSSATTVANDDFVYHAPKSRQHQSPSITQTPLAFRTSRPPAELPSEALAMNINYLNSDSSESSSGATSFRSSTSSDLSDSSQSDFGTGQMIQIRTPSPRIGFVNPACNKNRRIITKRYFGDTMKQDSQKNDLNNSFHKESTSDNFSSLEETQNTLSKKHRSSSLSMNDLDRLESSAELNQEDEMMFILPVKSESMLSLYKLYLAEDEESGSKSLRYSVEVSKSEGNLTVPQSSSRLPNEKHLSVGVATTGIFVKQDGGDLELKKRRSIAGSGSSSKIRRQHKIQKAKGNIYRAKHSLTTHIEIPAERNSEIKMSSPQVVTRKQLSEGVEVMVVDKNQKKNGNITIKDPSILSVEELFNVLGRASKKEQEKDQVITVASQDSSVVKRMNEASRNQLSSIIEFKKIFVSEYI